VFIDRRARPWALAGTVFLAFAATGCTTTSNVVRISAPADSAIRSYGPGAYELGANANGFAARIVVRASGGHIVILAADGAFASHHALWTPGYSFAIRSADGRVDRWTIPPAQRHATRYFSGYRRVCLTVASAGTAVSSSTHGACDGLTFPQGTVVTAHLTAENPNTGVFFVAKTLRITLHLRR
jgi:hypothetical protein